ncbi:MAG TPA: hypothetical protein VJA25_09330 [Dehalococcoidia bacterium]|nr:hypothetical protein [Dehalococcoidia bacterium]
MGFFSSKTTVALPPPSAEETGLQGTQFQGLQELAGQPGLPNLTPEMLGQLQALFSQLQARGTADLERFGKQLAGSRGLNITDTPIADPLMRAQADFLSSLFGQQAQQHLGLQQQAFQNRLGLFGNFPQALGGLRNIRAAQPTTESRPSGFDILSRILQGGGQAMQMFPGSSGVEDMRFPMMMGLGG